MINPEMTALEEYVLAARAGDEGWMFWFGWAERIGPAGDIEAAVIRIKRVLAPGGD